MKLPKSIARLICKYRGHNWFRMGYEYHEKSPQGCEMWIDYRCLRCDEIKKEYRPGCRTFGTIPMQSMQSMQGATVAIGNQALYNNITGVNKEVVFEVKK